MWYAQRLDVCCTYVQVTVITDDKITLVDGKQTRGGKA